MNFERQDLRRIWLVLGAIETLDNPSLSQLENNLDMRMSTIQRVIARVNSSQIPGCEIDVDDGRYSVSKWGVVNKDECINFYINACGTLGA